MKSSYLGFVLAAFIVLAARFPAPAAAQTLPERFENVNVISGLTNPTVVRFASDGRVFVAEKEGIIKVYDGLADTTPDIFADLSAEVHAFWDRGLLGLALHPSFPTQPYVYVLYTYDAPPGQTAPYWNDRCDDPVGNGCVVQGRVSRLRAEGNVATGDEQIFVQDWCQQHPSHSIGGLTFAPDGALLVSGGDGASFTFVDYGQSGAPLNPCGDPPAGAGGTQTPPTAEGGALRSQDVRTPADATTMDGAILRLDPMTGAALATNPFYGGSTPGDDAVIAYGLRNPLRMSVRPGTDEVWIGDVGWVEWEEINVIASTSDAAAENFGWPCYEGAGRQSAYDAADLALCETLYLEAGTEQAPLYTYHHNETVAAGDGCPVGTSAITGIAFYVNGAYPTEYRGAAFFADYARQCIWAMLPDAPGQRPNPANRRGFATVAPAVDLQIGPGGDLYYVDHGAGVVHRIRYQRDNQTPIASAMATPSDGAAPLLVSLSAAGSTDPDLDDSLTYDWDLDGDGEYDDASGVEVSRTFDAGGTYFVTVRVTDLAGASSTSTVMIMVDNTAPVASIVAPTEGTTWRVGDEITFSGQAMDQEEGLLPGTALSWNVLLHHCASLNNCHAHPLMGISGASSGTLTAPEHEYPAYLELQLTATDSHGSTHTTSLVLEPQTVDVELRTIPSGLEVAVSAHIEHTPFTIQAIAGSRASVSIASPQELDGVAYEFQAWSDEGGRSHLIDLDEDMTLTAELRARTSEGDASVPADGGSDITDGGTNVPDAGTVTSPDGGTDGGCSAVPRPSGSPMVSLALLIAATWIRSRRTFRPVARRKCE